MVRDGQTVLIAGLIEETLVEESAGIPVLGSLPLVGGAFRTTTERAAKSELVVLLTPRLVREEHAAARGAWLAAEGRAALDRAALGLPRHGRLPRAAALHAQARRAFCEGRLREAWRKSGEAVRLHPTEPEYAALRRDVAAALCARGERPPAWTARLHGDWTDPALRCGPAIVLPPRDLPTLPGDCHAGCRCDRCLPPLPPPPAAPPVLAPPADPFAPAFD